MNVFELTCTELAGELKRRFGKGLFHAAAISREIFKRGNASFGGAPEFARSGFLAERIGEDLHWPSCRIVAREEEEGIVKFGSALADGRVIESVVIPSGGRRTLCVSSQAGCRMGCAFCATGAMGWGRNLTVEEIVWQVYAARFDLGFRIDNLVFMGMGEPLDNFEAVLQAVRVASDQRGLDIALSHITLSTAGHADGIRKLGGLKGPKPHLAVSLHAANDALRSILMPINRKYPLARLKEELLAYPLGKGGVFFIEVVLLAGVNDSRDHARELARYLDGLPVRVNVIAYSGGSAGRFTIPDPEHVQRFCGWLAEEKLFVRPRRSRGRDILAACGQLGASLREETPHCEPSYL